MSAKWILGAMVAGSAAVLWLVPDRAADVPVVAAPRLHERPWLTREAAAEIVSDKGSLGPLFADVTLGGPPPSPGTRARIAAFARSHDIDVGFEVVDDELVAIRFAVTFGGCCGYEGADTLARRLARPRTQSCCTCQHEWLDDWNVTTEDGVQVRGRVRVNRVEIRWEPTTTLPELVARADGLIGQDRDRVRARAGDRWSALGFDQRYRLEVPHTFADPWEFDPETKLRDREDLGLQVTVARGRIAQVAFVMHDSGEDLSELLVARWGKPRLTEDRMSWLTRDRVITAVRERSTIKLVIRRSGALASR